MNRALPGHGLLLFDALTPDQAVEQATAMLRDMGLDDWDIAEVHLPTRLARAWWGGDEVGFVQEDHPNATAVVVVNLPGQDPA